MIAAAYYLLQVVLCSGILYGYYLLALRNKVFHHWNRYYLLATVGLSLLLPWIRIPVQQEPEAPVSPAVRMLDVVATGDVYVEELGRSETLQFSAGQWALIAYIVVGLVVLAASLKALLHIRRLWLRHAHVEVEGCRFVVTRERGTPFSFMRNIFWHADISLSSEAGQRILKHELVHVREKHTHDKLFLGAILVPFWSNPFFWLIRREMAMIHEFIADRRSVDGPDGAAFAAMLLEAAYPGRSHLLANAFFHSPLKRRLKMLLSTRNTRTSYVTRVLALPLLALVVAAFTLRPASNRDMIPVDPKAGVFTVVIDAGHGGHDAGVRSSDSKLTEKELALAIAQHIRELNTDPSLNIVLLREKDEYQPLKEKVEKAIALKPDAFVSIHINGASEQGNGPDRSGIEVFLGTKNKRILPASAQLGSMITGSLTGIYPTMDILRTRSSSIYVLDAPQIDYPAALVEVGYLTNATDRAFITNPENQAAVARGILKALAGFRTIRGTQPSMQLDTLPGGGTKTGQVTMKIAGDVTGAEPVLVFINGQKMDMKQLNGMTITADSAIYFEKNDAEAIKKFGAEGKKGVLIFNSAEVGKTPSEEKRIVNIQFSGTKPESSDKKTLIVIDGKSYGMALPGELSALKELSPNDIATINVIGKEAEKLYGQDGKQGAMVITTKQGSALELTKTPETMLIRMDTTPSGVQIREVTAIRYRKPAGGNSDPLVVIDGQRLGQLSGAKLDQVIDPTRIESINVLKGESAEKLYGAEGKNGVIMITSKAAAAAASGPVGPPKPPPYPAAPQAASPVDPFGEVGKIFTKVEQAPEFPGGAQVMKDFLRSRLNNDPEVKSNKKSYKGKAGIRFVVYQQGSVGAFAIDDKSVGNEQLAAKLIEYLKRGPQWEPARQNGKIVKVWHQVEFSY
jgi:TonB-dependent SusC/RagA subfamily outer membrane receptor